MPLSFLPIPCGLLMTSCGDLFCQSSGCFRSDLQYIQFLVSVSVGETSSGSSYSAIVHVLPILNILNINVVLHPETLKMAFGIADLHFWPHLFSGPLFQTTFQKLLFSENEKILWGLLPWLLSLRRKQRKAWLSSGGFSANMEGNRRK